jgi:hypothetical protein
VVSSACGGEVLVINPISEEPPVVGAPWTGSEAREVGVVGDQQLSDLDSGGAGAALGQRLVEPGWDAVAARLGRCLATGWIWFASGPLPV